MSKEIKLPKLFKKTPKTDITHNPWLDIPHDHDWLPANEGTEWVCGLCGERKPQAEEKPSKK